MTEAQSVKNNTERRKRTRYEIIHDLLAQCENGAKKTWLMYRANLSYELTNNYINKLVEKGLITQKDDLYYITEKGQKLMQLLRQYVDKKKQIDQIIPQIQELYSQE